MPRSGQRLRREVEEFGDVLAELADNVRTASRWRLQLLVESVVRRYARLRMVAGVGLDAGKKVTEYRAPGVHFEEVEDIGAKDDGGV